MENNNLANVQQYNYQDDFLGWVNMVHGIMDRQPNIYENMTELEKATWALAHSNMLIHSDFMMIFNLIANEQAKQLEQKEQMESTMAPLLEALEEVQKKQAAQNSQATIHNLKETVEKQQATAAKTKRASVTEITGNK